jgi:hypothetical protein
LAAESRPRQVSEPVSQVTATLPGVRAEPQEIEAVLAEHPGVREVVVLAVPGPLQDVRLLAFWVPAAQPEPKAGELRVHLRSRLPEAMVPTLLMPVASLPLLTNGKVDRAALLAAADGFEPAAPVAYAPPRNRVEGTVAAVFQEVLGRERVGIHDNFFDLGGHSLLVMALNHRLAGELGRDIPVMAHFQHTTVSARAEYLDHGERTEVLVEERRALAEGRKAAMGNRRRLREAGRAGLD